MRQYSWLWLAVKSGAVTTDAWLVAASLVPRMLMVTEVRVPSALATAKVSV